MNKMPTLGSSRRKNHSGKAFALLLAMAVATAWYWWKHQPKGLPQNLPPTQVTADNATSPAAPAAVDAPPAEKPSPYKRLFVTVSGPLETSIIQSAGAEEGPALAQVITRALVWWMMVPNDFRKGDKLEVLYEERPNAEPLLHAVRFESLKYAKTFRAYRYTPPDHPFARFYQPNGEELEMRLAASPLDDYEQITSLIRDGRRHKGVDFKAPVGTAVKATFDGKITRKNWNWRSNGNCLEVTEHSGRRRALFLHLSELPKDLKVGQAVKAGQKIAESGNSGHSFAPHLHYQLMAGKDKVLDPFDGGSNTRRNLPPEQRAAFDAEVQRLDGLLGTSAVANANATTNP